MAYQETTHEQALKMAYTFAKSDSTSANAYDLKDGQKLLATVTGFKTSDIANSAGFYPLYCWVKSANGELKFKVSNPPLDLPRLPIGQQVQVKAVTRTISQRDENGNEMPETAKEVKYISFVDIVGTVSQTEIKVTKSAAKVV